MPLAPIALFAYKRLDHLQQTISALQSNLLAAESELIVFSDAAGTQRDQADVDAVRRYLSCISGFKSVAIEASEHNLGLSRSIINGVSKVVEHYGSVIVLEDDMVTSRHFLQFMNDALSLYHNEDKVASVHGYVYPVLEQLPETFFLRGADCWGWATWKRGWDMFEANGRRLLDEIKRQGLKKRFDMDGTYPFTRMLRQQIEGTNDSWAIRWHATAFLHNRLTLYPGKTLVRNIGLDGSGTHCSVTEKLTSMPGDTPVSVGQIDLREDEAARLAFCRYFRSIQRPLISRVFSRLGL